MRSKYLLEAPLKGSVLLHMLAVLCQGGCADAAELPSGKHGLQQIGSIHCAICLASPKHLQQMIPKSEDQQRVTFSLGLLCPNCSSHQLAGVEE